MVDKVIVKVSGGIGNQLFQVAFGITAGRYLNARVEIDDSSFENYAYHHHSEIQKLNLGLEKFCDNTKNSSDYLLLLRWVEGLCAKYNSSKMSDHRCANRLIVALTHWNPQLDKLIYAISPKHSSNTYRMKIKFSDPAEACFVEVACQ